LSAGAADAALARVFGATGWRRKCTNRRPKRRSVQCMRCIACTTPSPGCLSA